MQTICRQRIDEMDWSDTQRGSFLVSEVVRYSPHSIVPWADRIVENWWSLEKQFLHIFQRSERGLKSSTKLADRWKSGVWLGKSDLTDEHLVRTDDGVVYARSVRRLAENSWSEETLKAVVEAPQKPRSMTTGVAPDTRVVPEVHEQENPNEEANENDDERETLPEPDTAAMSSSSRGDDLSHWFLKIQ